MEALFAKLLEYLQMEEEIPYAEFAAYFKDVVAEWQKNYQQYDKETLLKCQSIASVVAANAIDRGKENKKDVSGKKFKKMAEKMTFWAQAIEMRLEKEHNMTKDQVDAEIDRLLADV